MPRLSPISQNGLLNATRLDIIIAQTAHTARLGDAWAICYRAPDHNRYYACTDSPLDYQHGLPADHAPGDGLIAIYKTPAAARADIDALGVTAPLYIDGIPQTVAAALEAGAAFVIQDTPWTDRYQIARDIYGGAVEISYCRDCGHYVRYAIDGCEACGFGRLLSATERAQLADEDKRLAALEN